MSDNTTLNSGTGGDVARTVERPAPSSPDGAAATKTEVVQLDVGGAGGNGMLVESLVSGNNPMPVADPYTLIGAQMLSQLIDLQQTPPGGFCLPNPGFTGV